MTVQDNYIWVYEIIASCKTRFHFDCADILIELFRVKYPDNPEMRSMLIDLRADKFREIFNDNAA